MERLALRVLSSRADSFRGSICFISTEAERGRRKREGGRNINKTERKQSQKVI